MILALTFPACIWAMFYGTDIGEIMFENPTLQVMMHGLWVPLFLNSCVSALTIIPYKILLAENRAAQIFKANLFILILYPVLLYGSLQLFGYPVGLYALPALMGLLLAQYLWRMGNIGEIQTQFIREILTQSMIVGAIFAAIFAVTQQFLIPLGASRIIAALWIGMPAAIATLAYVYWAIARPRLSARGK